MVALLSALAAVSLDRFSSWMAARYHSGSFVVVVSVVTVVLVVVVAVVVVVDDVVTVVVVVVDVVAVVVVVVVVTVVVVYVVTVVVVAEMVVVDEVDLAGLTHARPFIPNEYDSPVHCPVPIAPWAWYAHQHQPRLKTSWTGPVVWLSLPLPH